MSADIEQAVRRFFASSQYGSVDDVARVIGVTKFKIRSWALRVGIPRAGHVLVFDLDAALRAAANFASSRAA